uniref:Uncharacterized protein n=1 Tax=Anguilla anguilla TaxID=7936 RepID=A0A0E9WB16_ANGAN
MLKRNTKSKQFACCWFVLDMRSTFSYCW